MGLRLDIMLSASKRGAIALSRRAASPAVLQARFGSSYLEVKEVEERVMSVLSGFEKVESASLTPTSHFKNDLGLDSLDTVEVVMAVEEELWSRSLTQMQRKFSLAKRPLSTSLHTPKPSNLCYEWIRGVDSRTPDQPTACRKRLCFNHVTIR